MTHPTLTFTEVYAEEHRSGNEDTGTNVTVQAHYCPEIRTGILEVRAVCWLDGPDDDHHPEGVEEGPQIIKCFTKNHLIREAISQFDSAVEEAQILLAMTKHERGRLMAFHYENDEKSLRLALEAYPEQDDDKDLPPICARCDGDGHYTVISGGYFDAAFGNYLPNEEEVECARCEGDGEVEGCVSCQREECECPGCDECGELDCDCPSKGLVSL